MSASVAPRMEGRAMPVDILDRLVAHKTLGNAPHRELEWLAAHGTMRRYEVGFVITHSAQAVNEMVVMFSGHLAFFSDRGGGHRKVMEWHGGDVSGMLPFSRLTSARGNGIIQETTDALVIHKRDFPELIRECPTVTAALVHTMLDRARVFNASDLHDEKMVSLGRLAAGLAHELNNPASAIARSAELLMTALTGAEDAARALGAVTLSPEQLVAVDHLRTACQIAPASRGAIERADHEDAIAAWLEEHGEDSSAATALADTGVDVARLDDLARELSGDALRAAVAWIAAECTARALASDIARAASRVHALVSAVKRFTYMDRATAPEPVDIRQGLADTIAVLSAKAREKSVDVSLHVGDDVPLVNGFGGELNQIWANLIDNAIDAVASSGRITVSARGEPEFVVVRVIDNGPGVPEDIRDRIFDPFFTTKPVGQGTGLGLDIAQRLVRRHHGEIDVDSRPGHTEFRVSLPLLIGPAPAP